MVSDRGNLNSAGSQQRSVSAGSCTLSFSPTNSSNEGAYVVQLVMEDFPRQTINLIQTSGSQEVKTTSNAISKIPVQFALKVDPVVPSCTEGLYLPKFLPPTPANRAQLHTPASQTLEIRINAQANNSTISELLFSGPHNINETTSGAGQFSLRWTPSESENGKSYPVCFVIQAESSSAKYHSEFRCVIVTVGTDCNTQQYIYYTKFSKCLLYNCKCNQFFLDNCTTDCNTQQYIYYTKFSKCLLYNCKCNQFFFDNYTTNHNTQRYINYTKFNKRLLYNCKCNQFFFNNCTTDCNTQQYIYYTKFSKCLLYNCKCNQFFFNNCTTNHNTQQYINYTKFNKRLLYNCKCNQFFFDNYTTNHNTQQYIYYTKFNKRLLYNCKCNQFFFNNCTTDCNTQQYIYHTKFNKCLLYNCKCNQFFFSNCTTDRNTKQYIYYTKFNKSTFSCYTSRHNSQHLKQLCCRSEYEDFLFISTI
ncbi:uncharacterized protein LOC122974464 [Thunnus albacares]|uniref:uncharacterized protein LOC122974464 n=1 Tax=Thunnus albacares TaxID=8236 RepID=UPI001CF6F538|nr:uncharacterized protein LOC122974464 [Thunnus albacares]